MSKDKTGKTLEQAVGRIQQLFDPQSTVTYREFITNRLGIRREFDVVIRGKFAGHPSLGVIECKDWQNKVGTPEIDAFINKTRDINANLRLIVSPKGFTEPALIQAKDAGVGVYSLLPDDPIEAGFSIGLMWYGRSFSWGTFQSSVTFVGEKPKDNYLHTEILFDRYPVINVLLRELSTTYLHDISCLVLILRCEFNTPISVSVNGKFYNLSAFNLFAPRVFRKKRRFMQVTGDAFYNWETGKVLFPEEGAAFSVYGIKPDMPDWDDYEGKIPKLDNFQFIINRYWGCIDVEKSQIPDLPIFDLKVEKILPALDIS